MSIISSWSKRSALYFISAVLVMQVFAGLFATPDASAISRPNDDTAELYDEIIKYQTVAGLMNCMNRKDQDPGDNKITYAQAAAGIWFNDDYGVYIGHLSGGEAVSCNGLVRTVAGYLNQTPIELLCSFVSVTKNTVPCTDHGASDYDFDPLDDPYRDVSGNKTEGVPYSQKFYENVVTAKLQLGSDSLSGAAKYFMYFTAFTDSQTCTATSARTVAPGWSTTKVNMLSTKTVTVPVDGVPAITTVEMQSKTMYYRTSSVWGVESGRAYDIKYVPVTGLISVPSKQSSFLSVGDDIKGTTYDGDGGDIATTIKKGIYQISPGSHYIQNPKGLSIWGDTDLVDHEGRGLFMHYEILDCSALAQALNQHSNSFTKWMEFNKKVSTETATVEEFIDPTDNTTSCSIDGIGWIVCPIMNFLAEVSDASFTFLAENFLSTNVSIVEASDDNGVYAGWKAMRNVANVLFIIAFLIIVFSQITGAGMSNYGAKKMLPRLVIAAILVNVSFFVCQIAVDLSNVLGYSLKDFFTSIGASIDIVKEAANGADVGNRFTAVLAAVLALGATATFLYVYVSALIPVLLAAVIGLLMILFILLTRQVLIVLLIVLAPVAFVAFLLPNTQKWFTVWRKAFIALLLVFPIIAVVYGAAALASEVLSSTFQTPNGDDNDNLWGQIMAAAILVMPLFVVPSLLKKSLDGIGGLGAKINSIGGKLQGAAGKRGTEAYNNSRLGQFKAYRKKEAATRRALIQSGAYSSRGPRGWASAANRKLNESRISGKFGNQALATGFAIANKEDAELVSNADSRLGDLKFDNKPLTQEQMIQIAKGQDVTHDGTQNGTVIAKASSFDEYTQRAAIQRAAKIATVAQAQELVDASPSMSVAKRKTLSSSLAASSVLGKAPYLGGRTLGEIEQGVANSTSAALQAIKDGKITSEVLAATDKTSATKLLEAVQSTASDSAERKILKAAYDGIYAKGSRLGEKIAPGGAHDAALRAIKSL